MRRQTSCAASRLRYKLLSTDCYGFRAGIVRGGLWSQVPFMFRNAVVPPIALLLLIVGATATHAVDSGRVELSYYGDIGCEHCDTFLDTIPLLEERYGLEIVASTFDILQSNVREESVQLLQRFGQQYRIFPILIIGNNAYQGNSAIDRNLPLELAYRAQNGTFRPRLTPEQIAADGGPGRDAALSFDNADPVLLYFWAEGCPACARAAPFLDELAARYPRLTIERYEVSHDLENRELFLRTAERWGADRLAVPAFFLPGRYWIGFGATAAREIPAAVQVGLTIGWSDVDHPQQGFAREYIDLPLFGRVTLADMPAFAVTGAIAAVDGFNPCSLWVLTFLIGLIVRTGSRARTLAVGLVFLAVTATVYGLFILGLFAAFSAFTAGAGPLAVRIVVALLAVTMGLVNMKDYFAFKTGFSLTIPERFQSVIARSGRTIFERSASLPALIATTALFALGISVVELPCTAGFPVIWSQYVASLGVSQGAFALLFALYLLIYVGAEIAVVVAAVVFMRRLSFGEAQARILKLLGGAIMVALGVAYLGFPEATRSFAGVGVIFLAAAGTVAVILLGSSLTAVANDRTT